MRAPRIAATHDTTHKARHTRPDTQGPTHIPCPPHRPQACIVLVSEHYRDRLGVAMASIGTVSGLGCMLGPAVGGFLYDLMADASQPPPSWAFRLPCIVCAIPPILLLAFVRRCVPPLELAAAEGATTERATTEGNTGVGRGGEAGGGGGDRGGGSIRSLLSPSLCLGLISVALSGSIVATLDPTLAYRLSSPPFSLSASAVSLFFTGSSVVYVLVSVRLPSPSALALPTPPS